MSEFEIANRFTSALQRGMKGQVDSFDFWLRGLGINKEKLGNQAILEFFANNPEKITDRVEEIEEIASFIGYYLREKKDKFHIVLLGVEGIGKTLLLRVVHKLVEKSNKQIKFLTFNAKDFSKVDEDGYSGIYEFLGKVKKNGADIIMIDSTEKAKNIDDVSEGFLKIKRGLVISAWVPNTWFKYRESVEECIDTAKEVNLNLMSKVEIVEFLNSVTTFASDGRFKISEDVHDAIWKFSKGIPGVSLSLLRHSLKEAFLKNQDGLNRENVINAARNMVLYDLDERLKELSNTQNIILNYIINSKDERGIRPMELGQLFQRDKATISYHLSNLFSNKILERSRIGKSTFYRIRDEIKPYIQLKLLKEGDLYE